MQLARSNPQHMSLMSKLTRINWVVVLLLCMIAAIGFVLLYSTAGGSFEPWAARQMTRFAVGLVIFLVAATIDIRFWLRYAYLFYLLAFLLLGSVEFFGAGAYGARRWMEFGGMRVQPSEIMKIGLILALARYFHRTALEDTVRPLYLIIPLLLMIAPVVLVLRQPDLGTAMMLVLVAGGIFFLSGVRVWKFVAIGVAGLAAVPIAWSKLHTYQQQRVLTFLNPNSDPLGAGYHILQSQIALGSGGIFGKGFLKGTQSHLSFLPEQQTDFIFTILAEEFGIIGGLLLLALYGALIVYGISVALRSRNQFGKILAFGVTLNFFLYVFINMAMVMGLIPVVGVPLPLVSYGGTAMLTLMFGFGLLMSVHVHRDVQISRHDPNEPV